MSKRYFHKYSNILLDKRKFEYQVCRTFEKNLVAELKVVKSHELILCLTDNQISVHEANEPFKTIENINKYKPVTAFAYSVCEVIFLFYNTSIFRIQICYY